MSMVPAESSRGSRGGAAQLRMGCGLLQFFGHSSPFVVAIQQLRRLLASSVVATRLGSTGKRLPS